MIKLRARIGYVVLLFLIVIAGYLPVAFGLLSLKNDIIQLDLPVKYFISRELHRGQLPFWMYNWGGGFPLGHLFTWSLYNPITLFFTAFFSYDIHTLHFEFMFYLLAGCAGIWKISKGILNLCTSASLVAASLYVLSGVTLSSTQFLAYISAIGMLPWVYFFFFKLFNKPCLLNSLSLGLCLFLLVSWSYPAAFIICTYSLLTLYLFKTFFLRNSLFSVKVFKFLMLSAIVLLVLSLPHLYITFKTLPYFNRSQQLSITQLNFGYLHPYTISSFFFPLANFKSRFENTEPLFQNINMGIIGIGLLFAVLFKLSLLGRYNKAVLYLLTGALLSLVLSFGHAFVVKDVLSKLLPGFGWFRFPSFFRIFLLLPMSLVIGICICKIKAACVADELYQKKVKLILACTILLALLVALINAPLHFSSVIPFIKNAIKTRTISFEILYFALVAWLCLLLAIVFFKKFIAKYLVILLVADLIITSLLSLPIYTVSSYSLKDMNQTLGISKKKEDAVVVDNTVGAIIDKKQNPFNGLNIYQNKISAADQYIGPLFLKSFDKLKISSYAATDFQQLIFAADIDKVYQTQVRITNNTFLGHEFSASIVARQNTQIILYQLWHPFWNAFVNGKPAKLFQNGNGLIYVNIVPGTHSITFKYSDWVMNVLTCIFFIAFGLLVSAIMLLKWRNKNV